MNEEQKPIIVVKNLSKHYGKVRALNEISFKVMPGSIVAILGPNGAGKTTLIRILTTLLLPDKGEAKILNFDVQHDAKKLRHHIGLAGQSVAVDENLTGRENIELIGNLYHLESEVIVRERNNLLKKFDLVDDAHRLTKTYSGGMRRRLDLALSLISNPKILFLDEPTTGLDPRSRLSLWETIRNLKKSGTTILLTTQYLEEADQLADEIIVIDNGKIIAIGTGEELKSKVGSDILEITFKNEVDMESATSALQTLGTSHPEKEKEGFKIMIPIKNKTSKMVEAIRILDNIQIEIVDIGIRRPTLDDVFLIVTGHNTQK